MRKPLRLPGSRHGRVPPRRLRQQGFTHILVPEINNGQLIKLLRARYLIDARPFNVIKGLPLREEEIEEQIESLLGERHV